MLALLKLVPLKDWLYIGCIAVLLAGFASYTVHERHVGEAVIEKKDAALKAAAVALNTASEHLADIKEIQIETQFKYIVDSAPVASTGLVCHNATPSAEQPHAAASEGPSDPAAANVLPSGSFDPSGPLLTLLRDADAQVNALLDRNAELEDLLDGKTQ